MHEIDCNDIGIDCKTMVTNSSIKPKSPKHLDDNPRHWDCCDCANTNYDKPMPVKNNC